MSNGPIPPQGRQGGGLPSPLSLAPGDWKDGIRRTLKEFKEDHGALIAAGMAFYWFLAVFPGLLAAVGILGLVDLGPDGAQSINKAIRSTLPGDAADVLTGAVDKATDPAARGSVIAAVVGLLVALWSASAGMVAMQDGLDVAYDVDEERKFVKKRVMALLLLVVAVVLGGVASSLLVFGQPIGDALQERLPFGSAFVVVWTLIRWGVAIVALTILFAAFYYIAPNRESPRWSWVSPGGVVGVLIWLLASLGFSFYVSSVGNYAKTYGSLTGVVVLLLWLYLSALAVVFGGEFNAELEREAAIEAGQVPPPPGEDAPDSTPPPSSAARAGRPASSGDTDSLAAWRQRMEELRRES